MSQRENLNLYIQIHYVSKRKLEFIECKFIIFIKILMNFMSKYLTVHETEASYDAMILNNNNTPHVSYIIESDSCRYTTLIPPPPKASDIVYYANGNLETVPYSSYNTSLGPAVGVIVVPEGFAPDGKIRIVSLKFATSIGTSSDSAVGLKWGPTSKNTSLTNYTKVPTTDNAGSTANGRNDNGYLPSDNFSGTISLIDPEAKYNQTSNLIPSPYLNNVANPDYYGAIERYNNALSDFNGLSNTVTLVGLGSDYVAANAANNYFHLVSGMKWYLPAMGELGYLMARFKEINNAIAAAGGVAIPSTNLWSSTENDRGYAYYLRMDNGYVYNALKSAIYPVRPFAIVE